MWGYSSTHSTMYQPKNATPYQQEYSRDVDNNGGIGMQYHR